MSALHDLLHKVVDLLPHASEAHRGDMHQAVDDVPLYIEQLADDQDDEQLADEQQSPATPDLEKTS